MPSVPCAPRLGAERGWAAGDNIGGDLALVHGLVRELRAASGVVDGKAVLGAGAPLGVDLDAAGAVGVDTGGVQTQIVAVGPSADGDDNRFEAGLLVAVRMALRVAAGDGANGRRAAPLGNCNQ